ncbi:MAG: glycerophosphodiester phosphodiesterase [Gemmataceae bacterium]
MTSPVRFAHLAGSVWDDFRRSLVAFVVFDLLFRLANVWLLLPTITYALSRVMAHAGYVAVSNSEVLDFLLSPLGLLYAALLGIVSIALLLLEQAGLMVLASGQRPRVGIAFLEPVRVTRLAALLCGLTLLLVAPFAFLAWLTYHLLLSHQDINFFLAVRPPVFWLAVALGALIAMAALVTLGIAFVRWSFALPILLFEQQPPRTALRLGRERVRGSAWRVGLVLLGWWGSLFLVGAGLTAGYRFLAETLLARSSDKPITLILLLLVGQAALLALVSFVTVVGHAVLTRRLYLQCSAALALPTTSPTATPPLHSAWPVYLLAPVVVVAPTVLWLDLPALLKPRPPVQVTAHRGYSRAGPENTLSAIRKAIEAGADYTEIDVQLTADDVVVLLHDRDLKRVSGDPRRIDEVTYAQLGPLDVGRWFGPEFVGERIPTLKEVIEKCRGRIKLNIELKLYGPGERLAREVARIVTEQQFEDDCLITSFDRPALQAVEAANPKMRTGLIVANALGDVSRLEVDALSVRADWLTDDLLRLAHRRHLEVHVWTVNDATRMTQFIKRGVDNIITDEPGLLVRVRDDWQALTPAERIVLAARLLLGLDPLSP